MAHDSSSDIKKVLAAHGLPERLLPEGVDDVDFDEGTGRFEIRLPRSTELTFGGIKVRFAQAIRGLLQQGRIDRLEGIQAKPLMWVTVGGIEAEGDQVAFEVGPVRKRLPRHLFE